RVAGCRRLSGSCPPSRNLKASNSSSASARCSPSSVSRSPDAIRDGLRLHYRFLSWRRRIREIREVRAGRQERSRHILVDGDTLSYHGDSGEVGCYVAPRPLTRDNNYFEVSIVDSGVRGTIAVGLVPQSYSLDHQPGWLPDSVAYHADDGKLYSGRAKGRQFGSKCSSGDRIGCGIEPASFEVRTAQVFFTKNGERVGSTVMPRGPEGLFPAVGMHSLGEEVRLHLRAELGAEQDEGAMMVVDSHEDEWGRLHDVRACGTIIGKKEAAVPRGGYFPTVGMLSSGEKVKVDLHPLSG
uniref:SPRY domain containing 3 n=1 Tax=Anser brachyrhynchus TaxID=132585 RepID=A0A8B9I8C0_9AVES